MEKELTRSDFELKLIADIEARKEVLHAEIATLNQLLDELNITQMVQEIEQLDPVVEKLDKEIQKEETKARRKRAKKAPKSSRRNVKADVLMFLTENEGTLFSASQIEEKTKISSSSMSNALKGMVERGDVIKIEHEGRSVYGLKIEAEPSEAMKLGITTGGPTRDEAEKIRTGHLSVAGQS